MKETDLNLILPPVILRYRKDPSNIPISLAIPDVIPNLQWHDDSLERLIQALLDFSVAADEPGMPIRLSVSSRPHWTDLEELRQDSGPVCWMQFSVEAQFTPDSCRTFRELPGKFGYQLLEEWEVKPDCKLFSFLSYVDASQAIFLSIQKHKGRGRCSLLIPIPNRAAQRGLFSPSNPGSEVPT